MRKTKVYIAGPYSKPDPCINTNLAMDIWNRLYYHGYIPFCPHWSHFQHTFHPLPYEEWLKYDLEWIKSCDCLLRLPGESPGAYREVIFAKEVIKIPVFYGLANLLQIMPKEIP